MTMTPWLTEENKYEVDYLGYKGYVVRHHQFGCLNGYVVISKEHMLHGCKYCNELVRDLNVHGGITFANSCLINLNGTVAEILVSEKSNQWVFGFDTAHCYDLLPSLSDAGLPEQVYRDKDYVIEQVKRLISQLKALEV